MWNVVWTVWRDRHFPDFDVIFVDNGSVDGSRELTEKKYPWVKVIALAENTGFCKAVNLGIEATQTPYVVLLNNDTEAEPDFLKELYLGIERKKNAFSGAARMLQFHDRGKMDDAGNYYNCLGWAFALGKGKPEENYLKERKIFASCGGAAIYRTELVKKLGGLTRSILHISKTSISDTGRRSPGTKTGICRKQGCTMWEAELPAPATINSRSGILREIISICFIKTCPFCRSF